jgi:hypothetical protein
MESKNVMNNLTSTSVDSAEFSVKEFILMFKEWRKYLLSKWLLILLLGLLGGLLGFIYAKFKKTTYTATTTFVLEEGSGGGAGALGQYAGLASMVGVDVGGGGGLFSGDNIIELYKSRSMLQKALLDSFFLDNKKLLLIERYFEGKSQEERDKSNSILKGTINSTKIRLQDSLVGVVVNDIKMNYLNVAKIDKKLSIIKVEVQSKDEVFAKEFADKVVATVNMFYIDTKTKRSIENIIILKRQKDSVQAVMNGAIFASAATMDATPNLNPTRQTLRAPVQKAQFNAESNKTILGELVKNLELSKISLRKETPLIQVIDQPIYPLEKNRLGKSKGVIIGGILTGFLTIMVLITKRTFKKLLDE